MPKKEKKPEQTAKQNEKERNELTTKMEGDLPYDRHSYVSDVRFLIRRSMTDILDAGKRLLIIREHEGYGAFTAICEEEIGIPHTTAYRYMNAALKAEKHPTIKFNDFSHVGKVYTLLEAPEEDLKELEEQGVMAGKTIDELQTMSVRDMRELIRSLKEDVGGIVERETKKVKTENKLLRQELDGYNEIFPPAAGKTSKAEKQLLYAQAMYDKFEAAVGALCFADMEIEDDGIAARIDGTLKTMHARLLHFAEKWDAHKRGEILS